MEKDEQVFQYMKEEIEKLAATQEQEILAEAKQIEADAYESIKAQAKYDANKQLEKELVKITSQASLTSSTQSEAKMKKLVAQRDQYVDQIFAAAQNKLQQFIQSDQYEQYLIKNFKAKTKDLVLPGSTIYVSENDLRYQTKLKAAYGLDVTVKSSPDIKLGGFILENTATNLVLDESLDFALANQKDWFYKTSGLMIK